MKFSWPIFLIFSICNIINPLHATILVKFPKAFQHYLKYRPEGQNVSSPLDDFGTNSRLSLCNEVILAKQFRTTYYRSEYARRKTPLPPPDSNFGSETNYQRLMQYFFSEDELKFKVHLVKHAGKLVPMKLIQCVESPTVECFITYGFVGRTFYLLERDLTRNKQPALQMTGLLEASAVISNETQEYFERQLATPRSRDSMESICQFALSDVLRLCSAVFDVLATEGSLRDDIQWMNHFRAERHWCLNKSVTVNDVLKEVRPLRCRILEQGVERTLFYILADSRKRGSAFVFFETENAGQLEFRMHVTHLGALLSPIGSREVPLRMETEEDNATNEEHGMLNDVFTEEDTIDVKTDEKKRPKFRHLGDI